MRWLIPLLLASLVTLGISISSIGRAAPATPSLPSLDHSWPLPSEAEWPARPPAAPARVRCVRSDTLRLHRFEDGSARLECAGRTLVRVVVPG